MSFQASTLELDRAESSRAALRPLILFCCAHFFIDMYSSALGVMQPSLLAQYGLSLTQAGILAGTLVFSSSMMQPVYGYLSDRFHTYLFTALAPALPGILMTVLLLAFLRLSPPSSGSRLRFDLAPLRAVRRPLAILFLLVVIRSIVQVTFAQFLPLYLKLQQGYTLANASYITSAYLLGGALGGFTGGTLADRLGGRRLIIFSVICSVAFLLLFVFTSGWDSIARLILCG